MFYTGYTNEKTDKKYFWKKLQTFDYIHALSTIYDSHVSFNGRAYVAEKLEYKESVKNDVVVRAVLISYNTIVCEWNPYEGFIRYWDGYSSTTMRHINEFRRQHGLQNINKKNMGRYSREKLGGVIRLYVIFRWVYNTRKILDFTNVVTIELKDGCYVLKCLDKTTRYINADEYKIICVELED